MVVSILRFVIELPENVTLKEKRRIIHSLKDKLYQKFKLSVAEIALNESHKFTQIGAVLVSNSKTHGEKVLHKALNYTEENVFGRLMDVTIFSEYY
ncbi:MAG: DUF503 domain-containing protein [Spirochaetales bacterium]|nr:DUF503 domain-containing protein [Spirochaetales bacterium]